jgi:transmembrane sensor
VVSPSRTPRRTEASAVTPEATPAPAVATAQDRLRDADRLRAAGQLEDAARVLSSIADDPSAGSERALAAFTLGRLELDRRGRPREAADAFARAIELGLRAPLLEDARARRVQALSRIDREAARRAADDYLAHHPDGRWRTEIEAWIATP